MATTKDQIFVGDSYAVRFDCYEPSETSFAKVPLNPSRGVARLWSVQNQEYVPLGDDDETEEAEATVEGNSVIYIVPATKTTEVGYYKLYVTVEFDDGQVVTNVREFKISAKQ